MGKKIIVLGGGGHAGVLIDILKLQNAEILGVTVPNNAKEKIAGRKIIGDDQIVFNYQPGDIQLVNGLGSIASPEKRKELFAYFKKAGYSFAQVIHPSAIIAADVTMGEGVQVMAGAIVQPGCTIKHNTIVNTRATIDHDCSLGAHTHIASGAVLAGNIVVEDEVHIGVGATVIQGVHIGEKSLVGAGAVVVKDVNKCSKVLGVPAKEVD